MTFYQGDNEYGITKKEDYMKTKIAEGSKQ